MSRPECSWACLSLPPASTCLLEVVGERELVQRAADDGLGLVALGDDDRRQPVIAGGDPAVSADEIDVVGPLHQELGHDRVVVVVLGEMAVGALLGLVAARQIGAGFGDRPFALRAVGPWRRRRLGRCAARWC